MVPIVAFFVIMSLLALGDVISAKTKAFVPSLFIFVICLLGGVWSGILPVNVVEIGGISGPLTSLTMIIIVVNMGSKLSIRELKAQWRTILIGLVSVFGVGFGILTIGTAIYGWEMAVVAAPPISGGLVASYEMAEAARAKGLDYYAMVSLLVLTLQSFPAYVVLPYILKKQAKDYLRTRSTDSAAVQAAVNEAEHKRLFPPIPAKYATSSVYLFTVALVGVAAYLVSSVTPAIFPPSGISATIFALVFGVIAAETGLIEKKPLEKANAFGFLIMASLVGTMASLASAKVEEVLSTIIPIFVLVIIAMLGIAVITFIISRILKYPWAMAFAIGLNCLLGFPINYLLTTEAIRAVAGNEDESEYLTEKMVPVMLVGGFTTVTIGSVVFAGILKNFL